jgi:hypothetical protein
VLLGIGAFNPAWAEREPTVGAAGSEAAPLRPPALNHLYVVLDAETFAALRDSPWVEQVLATPDAGLPDFHKPTGDSDRLFIRGRNSYLEFFAPDNRFGEPVGKVGIALGLDAASDLKALEQAWRGAYGADVRHTEVKFSRTDPPVPWYDAVQVDATSNNTHLVVWAMTYKPGFVAWLSGDAGTDARIRRIDVLAGRWRDGQNFEDIVGLSLAVPRPLYERLVEQFRKAGMQRDDSAGTTRLDGDGWYLLIQPLESDASRLNYIELRAGGWMETGCALVLGSALIDVQHVGTMRWRFGTEGERLLPPCRQGVP